MQDDEDEDEDDDDTELARTIQASLDHSAVEDDEIDDPEMMLGIHESLQDRSQHQEGPHRPSTSYQNNAMEEYATPGRLETALSIAGARRPSFNRTPHMQQQHTPQRNSSTSVPRRSSDINMLPPDSISRATPTKADLQQRRSIQTLSSPHNEEPPIASSSQSQIAQPATPTKVAPSRSVQSLTPGDNPRVSNQQGTSAEGQTVTQRKPSVDSMFGSPTLLGQGQSSPQLPLPITAVSSDSDDAEDMEEVDVHPQPLSPPLTSGSLVESQLLLRTHRSVPSTPDTERMSIPTTPIVETQTTLDFETHQKTRSRPPTPDGISFDSPEPEPIDSDSDQDEGHTEAAALAEEDEFANFVSQVKGRNVDDVRQEIDDEIDTLRKAKKVAMRDAEDVTQQMSSEIMVCSL